MKPAVSRFRDKFICKTRDYGVNQKAIRCYVQRDEEYIGAHPEPQRESTDSPGATTHSK